MAATPTHPPPSWNGGTTVHSGGLWAGANLSPTGICVWSTSQDRDRRPLAIIQSTGQWRRGDWLPHPQLGHEASVWQLAGEEEPSSSPEVPLLIVKQTRPPATAPNGGLGLVSHPRFYVLLPLSLLLRNLR